MSQNINVQDVIFVYCCLTVKLADKINLVSC